MPKNRHHPYIIVRNKDAYTVSSLARPKRTEHIQLPNPESNITMSALPSGYRVERYGPNESVPTVATRELLAKASRVALPGDFILTHSSGLYGKAIRFGEAIRYWGRDRVFAHWSHAAIFINESGDIIEALGGGVQQRNISVYHGTEYVVVHLPAETVPLDREEAVKFAEFCLNDPYGWLTILNLAVCLLSGSKISFGVDGQQICSALVARCLERIGEIFRKLSHGILCPPISRNILMFNSRVKKANLPIPMQD